MISSGFAFLLKFSSVENANGSVIADAEYQALKDELLQKKAVLEKALQVEGQDAEKWIELSEKTFDFARYAPFHFSKGDINTKRAILASLGSNLELGDRKLNITLRPIFQTIADYLPKAEKELTLVRTSEKPESKRKSGASRPANPSLLPLLDAFRPLDWKKVAEQMRGLALFKRQ